MKQYLNMNIASRLILLGFASLGSAALTAEQVGLVRAWIEQGAK